MSRLIKNLRFRLEVYKGIIDVLGEETDERVVSAARNVRKRLVLEQDREALANAGAPVLKVQG